MKKLFFILSLLVACFSNCYAQTAQEIQLTVTNKVVQGSGAYANLVLSGMHDTYGKITIYLDSYNGSYKTYTVYYAMIGKTEVNGKGTWSKDGQSEVLDATLSTAKYGTTPTANDQVFHIVATYTPEDVVTLNFSGFSKFGYDSNYGDWFMRIEGAPSTPEDGYKVELAYYAPAHNGYGTFTSADNQINMADSYIHTPTGDVLFDSVSLTVEKKKLSDNLVQTIAKAKLSGKDGITYMVTCTHNSITPKTQITGEISSTILQRTADGFSLEGEANEFEALVTINSSRLVGKYSTKHFDMTSTRFFHKNEKLDIISIQAEVVSELKMGDMKCIANVAFLTRDTILYVIKMTHTFPAPTEYVDLTATNLIVNDMMSEELEVINFDAKNDDYILTGAWQATQIKEATYKGDDLTIELEDLQNNVKVYSLDASIDVKKDEYGRWGITGTMRGDNNVVYNLNLSYVVPTPVDTVVVRFDHSSRAIFTPDMDNDLLFENHDENYYASINVRNIEMESAFSILDVDKEFCGVKDSLTGEYTELADINGNLFQVGDTTFMRAELISMDAVLYDIELWYVVPTPIDTVTLSFPVTFGDMRDIDGYYQLYGPSPDTTYIVAFSPLSEEIEGTFINDGLFGKFGAEGGLMQMEYRNTYIAKMDDDNMVTAIMPLETGKMTVDMDENGDITAVVQAICADSIFYHITMTSHYEREYLNGDMQIGTVDQHYTAEDLVVIEDHSYEGFIYMAIVAEDESSMVALHFLTDSADADITIPEGVYKINRSFRPGTVFANSGPTDDGKLPPPFYATIDPFGRLMNCYMWVRGTVTVMNKNGNLYIEVDALNSYDRPIHIIYDSTLADVENIIPSESMPIKYIQHGQLFIRKDGVNYNVQGMR